jgi:DNA-binding response OmpR family regulator
MRRWRSCARPSPRGGIRRPSIISTPTILIVEQDILIRHPLAEYLRECGYLVLEAVDGAEAQQVLSDPGRPVDIVLADVNAPGAGGFGLASWIRGNRPGVQVLLAGTVASAAEKAGDLCNDGPTLSKPYDHQIVLDRIRRALAARDRAGDS